jgi:hypothetical protein
MTLHTQLRVGIRGAFASGDQVVFYDAGIPIVEALLPEKGSRGRYQIAVDYENEEAQI